MDLEPKFKSKKTIRTKKISLCVSNELSEVAEVA
jgi:hypothetical protein